MRSGLERWGLAARGGWVGSAGCTRVCRGGGGGGAGRRLLVSAVADQVCFQRKTRVMAGGGSRGWGGGGGKAGVGEGRGGRGRVGIQPREAIVTAKKGTQEEGRRRRRRKGGGQARRKRVPLRIWWSRTWC